MRRLFPPLVPESGDLLHLDALRLFAAAGIVFLHAADGFDITAWPGLNADAFRPLALCVDMFFCISGFVIAFVYSGKIRDVASYGTFLRRRVARLAPLHWLLLAIYVMVGVVVRSHGMHINHDVIFEWRCLPANALLLNSTGLFCPHPSFNWVSWSISAEMLMYLAAPLVFFGIRRHAALLGLAAVAAWLALTIATRDTEAWYMWTSVGGWIRAIPSFLFGAWLFAVRGQVARLPFAGAAFWLSIVGFAVGFAAGLPKLALLLTLYSAVIFGIAADAQKRSSPFVDTLAAGGRLTFSSYMLHPIVIMVVLSVVGDRILGLHGTARNALVFISFAVVWPVSYLSLMLFETPMRRWMSGGRKPAPRVATLAPASEPGRAR